MELLQVTTQEQARRTLMQLSAACKWGMKLNFVKTNLFDSMLKGELPKLTHKLPAVTL